MHQIDRRAAAAGAVAIALSKFQAAGGGYDASVGTERQPVYGSMRLPQ